MTSPDARRIVDVAPRVRSGDISPVDLVQSCIAQMDARPELNAFITRLDAQALEVARRHERDIRSGRYRGPLHGIPIAVKDLIDIAGTKTTSGSAVPVGTATTDAPVIRSLREAGAIIIGKTNLHEFAFGTTSDESAFGPVRNPHDPARSAGGSSGGSAAALASGMCFGALGTDTGGSIRIPSSACGTVGLKPTIDEISCEGVVPLSATLDHVGPMTRGVADAALMYETLAGRTTSAIAASTRHLTFGIAGTYFCDRIDEGVQQALDRARRALTSAGHTVRDIEIEHASITPDVYLHICLPEAAAFHGPLLDRFGSRYCTGVRLRLEMSRYILGEDYVRAMRLRRMLTNAVDAGMDGCDALLVPAQPTAAPPVGATTVTVAGKEEPVRAAMLRLTQLFNITGHPSIAVPGSHDADTLPRGLQIVGRRHQTVRLLEIALSVERLISQPFDIAQGRPPC